MHILYSFSLIVQWLHLRIYCHNVKYSRFSKSAIAAFLHPPIFTLRNIAGKQFLF